MVQRGWGAWGEEKRERPTIVHRESRGSALRRFRSQRSQVMVSRSQPRLSGAGVYTAGAKTSDHSHLVSMRLQGLPGLKQRLQAGKNAWPSIGAGSVSGVILGPLVMRHGYFGGFGLGQQFYS